MTAPCYCGAAHHVGPDGPGEALLLHRIGPGATCTRGPDGLWRATGPRAIPTTTSHPTIRAALLAAQPPEPR
jgi:hypothetical protein